MGLTRARRRIRGGEPWYDDVDQHLAAQKVRRDKRLPIRSKQIMALAKFGFKVELVAAWHFLINKRLDLYPLHNQWRDRKTNKKGSAKNLAVFVKEWVKG